MFADFVYFEAVNEALASFGVRTSKSIGLWRCFRKKINSKYFHRKSQQVVEGVKVDQKWAKSA